MTILEQIAALDVTSDEYFEIYRAVCEKYWNQKDTGPEHAMRTKCEMAANQSDAIPAIIAGSLLTAYEMLSLKGKREERVDITADDLHVVLLIGIHTAAECKSAREERIPGIKNPREDVH